MEPPTASALQPEPRTGDQFDERDLVVDGLVDLLRAERRASPAAALADWEFLESLAGVGHTSGSPLSGRDAVDYTLARFVALLADL